MYLFRAMGIAVRAWLSVLRLVWRPSLWLPFVFIAVVQLATLGLLVQFHRPPVTSWLLPIIELSSGDRATHYPLFFYLLPEIFTRVGVVLAVVIESLAVAVATLLFARAFGMQLSGVDRHRLVKIWPRLVLVTAIPAAVIFALSYALSQVSNDVVVASRLARWGVRGGYIVMFTLVQSLVAYATAWVVLKGSSPLVALLNSIRVASRTFLPTWIVIGVPVVMIYPFHYIVQRVDLFIDKLSPDTIAGIMAVRIVCEIVLGFVLVGAITRLFVWRIEAAR